MSITDATHAYVGTGACGCTLAVVIDSPDQRRETAKAVYGFILDGLAITRVDVTQVRDLFSACPHQASSHEKRGPRLYEVHHFVRSYVLSTNEEQAETLMWELADGVTGPVVYDAGETYMREVETVPDQYLDTYLLAYDGADRTCRELLADVQMGTKPPLVTQHESPEEPSHV